MNNSTFQGNGKVTYIPVVVNAKPEPITNADRIRSMTDEELAEFFPTTASEFSCPPSATNESCRNAGGWFNGCPKCWLGWLQQEVNDGKEEKEENQPAK